ncbi:MAG: hypothetical protein JXQ83_15480, partial [Candidatus Glassbacteria bacterium]|nr:hypothetical protein [Candidatus Glassbacteria bacterium]
MYVEDFEDFDFTGWTERDGDPLHPNWIIAEDFGDKSITMASETFDFGREYSLGEYIVYNDLELDFNYRITVWVRHNKVMTSWLDFAVIFYYESDDYYFYVGVNSNSDPLNTDGILEQNWNNPRPEFDPGSPHLYRYDPPSGEGSGGHEVIQEEYQELIIERRGQQIITYLDGEEIYNAVIPTLPWGGKLGLGAQNDRCLYDDIKIEKIVVEEDVVPPAQITDLALVEISDYKTASISWSAPGDDGLEGTAFSYDVRYSREEITEATFSAGKKPTGIPSPGEVGATETMTLSGLAPGTMYYVAVKTSDEQSNLSKLSNVLTFTTLEKEYRDMKADDFTSRTITLDGDLSDWDLESANKIEYSAAAVASGDIILQSSMDSTLDDTDFKAEVYIGWNYDGLYFAVTATDDAYLIAENPRSAYEGDGVEIFFDWDGDLEAADSSVVHFGLTPEQGQLYRGGPSSDPGATNGIGSWYSDLSTAGIEYFGVPGGDASSNWIIEIFVPWGMNGRGIVWDRRSLIGMKIAVHDNDSDTDGTGLVNSERTANNDLELLELQGEIVPLGLVVVDGVAEAKWDDLAGLDISTAFDNDPVISGTVKIGWDDAGLYYLFDVTDPELLVDEEHASAWETERVEIHPFLNADSSIYYYHNIGADGVCKVEMTAVGWSFQTVEEQGDIGIRWAAKLADDATGYVIEVSEAWDGDASYQQTYGEGDTVRVALAIYDQRAEESTQHLWGDRGGNPQQHLAYVVLEADGGVTYLGGGEDMLTVDGDAEGWEDYPGLDIATDFDNDPVISGSVKLAWDELGMYYLFDVTDPELLVDEEHKSAWSTERVEIQPYGAPDSGFYYYQNLGADGGSLFSGALPGWSPTYSNKGTANFQIERAVTLAEDNTGYVIEVFEPWLGPLSYRRSYGLGDTVRVAFAINDQRADEAVMHLWGDRGGNPQQ